MTYSAGSSILATDYNSLAGVTASAAASAAAATKVAGYLWGVGYGDRGYGQSSPALTAIASGTAITASSWTTLRSVLNSIATQQGSTVTLPAVAAASSAVVADVNYSTVLNTLDTNRNIAAAAGMTLTNAALTITRSTTWGSGNSSIVAVASFTFASEDAARYFFNTGGTLNVVLAHPSTASTQDSNWHTILSALGTIAFGTHATTRSGSGGTPAALGYYELTTAYQTIFNGANIGTGSYTANGVMVEALAQTITGSNGAKGSVINLRVTLTDGHTNAFSDSVASGTNAQFGFKKATVNVSGIASPTPATVTSF
jgi:hypothetical protein